MPTIKKTLKEKLDMVKNAIEPKTNTIRTFKPTGTADKAKTPIIHPHTIPHRKEAERFKNFLGRDV